MSGIFGQIAGKLTGLAGAEGADAGAAEGALGELLGGQGGVAGLLQQFEGSGLGEHIRSWIGNGQNLPITAEQLQQALSNQQVQALVQKTGLPVGSLMAMLAKVLPNAVDQATPNGQVPAGGTATPSDTGSSTGPA